MHALRCNDTATASGGGSSTGGALTNSGTSGVAGIAGGGGGGGVSGTNMGGSTSILQLQQQQPSQPLLQPNQQQQQQPPQLPKGGPVRINGIKGYQNRTNHIIYCPPLLRSKDDCTAVVYFGGDVQVCIL